MTDGINEPSATSTRECVLEDSPEQASELCTEDLSKTESCVKTCPNYSWSEWAAFGPCDCEKRVSVSERVCENADGVQEDNRQALKIEYLW